MLVALLSKERNVPKRMQSAASQHGHGRGGMDWLQTRSQQSGLVWPSVPGIARLPLVPVDPNGSNLEFVRLLCPNDSCWLEGFQEVIYQTMMLPKCSRCGAWSMGKCSGKTWRKNWRFGGHRLLGIGCVWESLTFHLSLIYITIYIFDDHLTSSKTLLSGSTLSSSISDHDPLFWSFLFLHLFLEGIWSAIGNGQGQLRIDPN